MGCSNSTEVGASPAAQQAAAAAKRVVAIDAQHCALQPTTLYMKERCWSLVAPDEDFLVRHAESGAEVFCVQGTNSPVAMKSLRLAASRDPIAHIKRDSIVRAPTFNVYSAAVAPAKLFAVDVQPSNSTGVGTCAVVEFVDAVSGNLCVVGVEGHWESKQALMWVERRDRSSKRRIGRRQDLARVYKPSRSQEETDAMGKQNDYFVGIAADMDMALVVLICMALDEATAEKRTLV